MLTFCPMMYGLQLRFQVVFDLMVVSLGYRPQAGVPEGAGVDGEGFAVAGCRPGWLRRESDPDGWSGWLPASRLLILRSALDRAARKAASGHCGTGWMRC